MTVRAIASVRVMVRHQSLHRVRGCQIEAFGHRYERGRSLHHAMPSSALSLGPSTADGPAPPNRGCVIAMTLGCLGVIASPRERAWRSSITGGLRHLDHFAAGSRLPVDASVGWGVPTVKAGYGIL